MGMFDTLYDGDKEYQTKAFRCLLDEYRVLGDAPTRIGNSHGIGTVAPRTYQFEAVSVETGETTIATVVNGRLVCLEDDVWDESIPHFDYYGTLTYSGDPDA